MTSQRRIETKDLRLLAAICIAAGLYGWAVFAGSFHHDGALGPRYNAPGADWMVFFAAARAYFAGNLPLIFDAQRFTAHLNQAFAGWLSGPLPFHPWLYPPHYLLLVLPFCLLPFGLSYAAFQAVTFVALLAAIWRYAEEAEWRWLLTAGLILAPATSVNVVSGQNAFLTAALLLGGFRLLRRHPILAGALFGVLTFKPTMWLMVPVALLAAGQWRALASAAATALILTAASVAMFGPELLRFWLQIMIAPPADFYQNWLEWGRLWGSSIFTCAMVLGASHAVATAIQGAATLAAAAIVYWAYRRPLAREQQLAVLLAATILGGPHVSAYDTLLLALAAMLACRRVIEEGWPLACLIPMLAAWIAPPLMSPRANPLGLALPVIGCALIATVIATTRQKAPESIVPAAI
jgi:alpha-1,2-mannosyltransferase